MRSIWRAEVELAAWDPRFEMSHRRVVAPTVVPRELALVSHPFAPIVRRTLKEADLT